MELIIGCLFSLILAMWHTVGCIFSCHVLRIRVTLLFLYSRKTITRKRCLCGILLVEVSCLCLGGSKRGGRRLTNEC